MCFQIGHRFRHYITTMTFERRWQKILSYCWVELWHLPIYFDSSYQFCNIICFFFINELGRKDMKDATWVLKMNSIYLHEVQKMTWWMNSNVSSFSKLVNWSQLKWHVSELVAYWAPHDIQSWNHLVVCL